MATTIRILPENLTNKIAAGEVVERPASVAKELVENAIDAGSKEVTVEIESGGRKLIKITDNGCGMSREDALLALERHATSKISSDDDLFALSTLGFRGEALPSIASVSRLTIATRTSDSLEGTELYAEGGRIKEVKSCGMATGTVLSVRNLFFNTPARLKFMKSAETEGGHVGELLTRLAISRPDVRFTYYQDGKLVFRALDADLKERVATMLGRPVAASLHPVSYQDDSGLKVSGLVAAPECSRSAGSHLYTYINGRFIRDKVVQHAILQAYRNFLERGRYPVVAIFIDIAPGEVDVNVHPTKHEVRFREQGRVHDAIQFAVESVLKETPWLKREPKKPAFGQDSKPTIASAAGNTAQPVPAGARPLPAAAGAGKTPSTAASILATATPAATTPLAAAAGFRATGSETTETAEGATPQPAVQPEQPRLMDGGTAKGAGYSEVSAAKVAEVRELLADYRPRTQPAFRPQFAWTEREQRTPTSSSEAAVSSEMQTDTALASRRAAAAVECNDAAEATSEPGAAVVSGAGKALTTGYFSSLSVIGQFNASYILCQLGTDLVIIDQHAAHERVAFERLKREFSEREVESQGLLFPETVELSFRESAVLVEYLDEVGRLGFAMEEFGGNTWLLKSVPQIMASSDYLRILRDILEELGSLSRSRTFTDIQEDILARMACHSVVRGRRPLAQQEIAALFRQMDETDFSSNCPHGRPVMQNITLGEVEKMFKRI
ncbi:DNA mismatch repair endonuclease MutL [Geomonas sp.]|uniref:DNA mismatch repair endonuclease MutL n=1 Tax=Geomonas sp. TaxID=2651584 RepID=UPI002B473E8B|nr:DNA mismatch repair endonuclease MutL [Geomonas sp.]HJV34668.1 DNA mismatch repair endonuclease MutL [Geomonas sp.]